MEGTRSRVIALERLCSGGPGCEASGARRGLFTRRAQHEAVAGDGSTVGRVKVAKDHGHRSAKSSQIVPHYGESFLFSSSEWNWIIYKLAL